MIRPGDEVTVQEGPWAPYRATLLQIDSGCALVQYDADLRVILGADPMVRDPGVAERWVLLRDCTPVSK